MFRKFIFIVLIASLLAETSFAYSIVNFPSTPVENNFIVGPAKIEVEIPDGESRSEILTIENRTGRDGIFRISFEDFTAGETAEETVRLLGAENGPFSLRNNISVTQNEFKLGHGDRLLLPITISVPAGTPAGNLFGSVIISSSPRATRKEDETQASVGANVIARIVTLIFATIPGDADMEGVLKSITTKSGRRIFFGTPVELRLLFENSGETYLNPYGIVSVKNIWGTTVERKILDPWFVLPYSERTRDVLLSGKLFFGKYTATAEINRGYEDIVDKDKATFYVVSPISLLVPLFLLIFIFLFIFLRQRSRTLI